MNPPKARYNKTLIELSAAYNRALDLSYTLKDELIQLIVENSLYKASCDIESFLNDTVAHDDCRAPLLWDMEEDILALNGFIRDYSPVRI